MIKGINAQTEEICRLSSSFVLIIFEEGTQ